MFAKILQWIREVVSKMLNPSLVKQAINVQPLLTPLMVNALQIWAQMYVDRPPWKKTDDNKTLNLPAAIASEVARAVTIEMKMQVSGSPRANYLSTQMQTVLDNLRPYTEYSAAKGGLMFKPYPKGEGLAIDYVQADMFYPTMFDSNGKMTACIFADVQVKGQTYYTRFEHHAMMPGGYRITNTAFKSNTKDTLGSPCPLTEVAEWAELLPEATIQNVDKPLFAYFRMPMANNIDPTSPLGVSIYARAVDLIKQADQQWTDFLWEFESGKRALYTDPLAFKKNPITNNPELPDKRLYRLLDLQNKLDNKGLFEEWTPTLREINLLNGLDAILRKIEFNCGLSYGVISNPDTVQLTATEIKSAKQRYYTTVTDIQKSLQDALDSLLYAMDVWASIYNLAPIGTYTTTYSWDDSIVSDADTQYQQDSQTVTMNAMPKYIFLMRNYGLSEVDAKKWVAETQAESPAPSLFPADNEA